MSENKFFSVQNLTRLALVAAVYVVLTLVIAPISYGPIQFRVSEVLVLLCFYRRDYGAALILGCFIANLFSPFGLYDIIFGTLATTVAVLPMYYVNNVFLAALFPVVSNALIVGAELFLCGEPFWFSVGTVALGEFVVVFLLGGILFKAALEKSAVFMRVIGSEKQIVTRE